MSVLTLDELHGGADILSVDTLGELIGVVPTRDSLRDVLTWVKADKNNSELIDRVAGVTGSSRFVVNDPAVAGIHATVLAALVSRIRVR